MNCESPAAVKFKKMAKVKVMIVASITLASGDVPLLTQKAFSELDCDTYLFSVEEDLPLVEFLFYRDVMDFNRPLFNRRLYKALKKYRPDILLIYGSNWGIFPKTLKKIKSRFNTRVIVWEGNLNFWKWYQTMSFPYYDHFFCTDSYSIPLLLKPSTGLKNVHFLGQGCDPDEHSRVSLSEEDKKRFAADLTFTGGGRPRRRALFEHLTKYNLKLWGWGWDESDILKPYMVKETVFGLKKTKIYSATPICPNLHSGLYQVNGISVRTFEVACCGRLPFAEPQVDLTRFFDVGNEVVTFNNPEDLKSKIDYYLSHPDEMEKMAERARQRAVSEHTYYHRMKELLEIVLS